jgi:hypothetical protein
MLQLATLLRKNQLLSVGLLTIRNLVSTVLIKFQKPNGHMNIVMTMLLLHSRGTC